MALLGRPELNLKLIIFYQIESGLGKGGAWQAHTRTLIVYTSGMRVVYTAYARLLSDVKMKELQGIFKSNTYAAKTVGCM